MPRGALHDAASARRCCGSCAGCWPTTATSACWCSNGGGARLRDTPEGNDFPHPAELDRQLSDAGFLVVDRVGCDELAPAPESWSERADRVQAAVAAEHGTDPRYRTAQDQQRRIADLLADGEIGGELVHARPADRS